MCKYQEHRVVVVCHLNHLKKITHMKTPLYKSFFHKPILLAIAIFALAGVSQAQYANDEKSADMQRIVNAQRFVFKAQSAQPTRGRIVHLSSDYDVAISQDTVRSSLPYFGRAYSAPMDGRSGGIDFTSKNFQYNKKERKKGGWEISIKPTDVNDVREMSLTVFGNGSASLRVFSNNREPISFNGYVSEK